ncbi:hypothetical protein NL478_28320, partial [Klebsiella pneumoniae]|nr:hypothetical protein [Klebsiella pneumoniae]
RVDSKWARPVPIANTAAAAAAAASTAVAAASIAMDSAGKTTKGRIRLVPAAEAARAPRVSRTAW